MNNWIGPTVKQLWILAMQVLHNLFGVNINTAAFCMGLSRLHLLILKSSMTRYMIETCMLLAEVRLCGHW